MPKRLRNTPLTRRRLLPLPPPPPAEQHVKVKFSKSGALAATAGYVDNTKTIIEGADTAMKFWDDHLARWVYSSPKKKEEEEGEEDADDGGKSEDHNDDDDDDDDHHHHHHHHHHHPSRTDGAAPPTKDSTAGEGGDTAAAASNHQPTTTSDPPEPDQYHDNPDQYPDYDSDSDQYSDQYYDSDPPEPFRVGDRVRFVRGSRGLHGNTGPFEVCRADAARDVYDVRFPGTAFVVGEGIEGDELDFVGVGGDA
ncbi:hypothetical protein SLS58_008617 [Diplodia intermedia]|uniref:Uncharacterized protein n=1 Tax=Diplodia intermedia TaxID=856260 RepID=A0ABR3TH22_9PEZI